MAQMTQQHARPHMTQCRDAPARGRVCSGNMSVAVKQTWPNVKATTNTRAQSVGWVIRGVKNTLPYLTFGVDVSRRHTIQR